VEVVNLGVPGYGVPQERTLLEEEGLPLDPNLVLVALCLGNELQETLGLTRRVYDPEINRLRGEPDHEIVDGRMVPISRRDEEEISAGERSGIKG
jgi:hypothetical protein